MSTIPKAKLQNISFFPMPKFVSQPTFRLTKNDYFERHNLPEVPAKYEDMVQELFFSGGRLPEFDSRIDPKQAYRAVNQWLSSWSPSHESKIATVAYALWVWSTKESIDEVEAESKS